MTVTWALEVCHSAGGRASSCLRPLPAPPPPPQLPAPGRHDVPGHHQRRRHPTHPCAAAAVSGSAVQRPAGPAAAGGRRQAQRQLRRKLGWCDVGGAAGGSSKSCSGCVRCKACHLSCCCMILAQLHFAYRSQPLNAIPASCACRFGGRHTCTASPRWSSSCVWQAAGHRWAVGGGHGGVVAGPAVAPPVHAALCCATHMRSQPHHELKLLQAASKQLREVLAEAAGRGAAAR